MSRPAASAETVPQEPPKTAVIYRARLGRRKAKVRWADDRSGLRGVLLAALSPLPRKSKRPVWMRNTTPPEDLTPESAQLILDEAENLYTIFAQPQPSGLVKRASMTTTDARWDRAMLLLHSADKNSYFTNFKILQVKVAGLWFRAALACFGALSVLLLIYAAAGPIPS
jgi:hypothetical protein